MCLCKAKLKRSKRFQKKIIGVSGSNHNNNNNVPEEEDNVSLAATEESLNILNVFSNQLAINENKFNQLNNEIAKNLSHELMSVLNNLKVQFHRSTLPYYYVSKFFDKDHPGYVLFFDKYIFFFI